MAQQKHGGKPNFKSFKSFRAKKAVKKGKRLATAEIAAGKKRKQEESLALTR